MRLRPRLARGAAMWLALLVAAPLWARVTPTSGFDLFSREEELQAGQQAAAQVPKQLPLLPEDDPVTRYVQRLGANLVAHAPGEKWPYTFRVVNQKEINAFALPGGPIFVNLGTIQAANSEAELAGVMAHEISHVVQRHGTRAASKQMAAQLPLAILGGIMGRSVLAQMAQLGISFGVGSYFLRNSRQAESEADLLGTDIMYDAGYDPRALAAFFSRLKEEQGRSGMVAQFFSDHPDPGNRSQAVLQEAATLPQKSFLASSSGFQRVKERVAGMKPLTAEQIAAEQANKAAPAAAGITPGEATQVFEHNEYQISYPEIWKVFGDQSSSVTIAPPSGVSQNAVAYGVIINDYQAEEANADLDQATHELIASLRQSNPEQREIGHDETIRVNGVAGKSVDLIGPSPIKDEAGKAIQERDWLVTFQRANGSLLYLVFIAPDKDFVGLRPTFEQMLKSVRLK